MTQHQKSRGIFKDGFEPKGRKREINTANASTIDGAPITYMIAFASVTAVFSFIPISVAMASGGAFPMSQGINPLVGFILGPIAGAITTCIGASVGVILAPHTAGIPMLTILGSTMSSLAAGCFVRYGPRRWWFLAIVAYSLVNYAFYGGRAIFFKGVEPWIALTGSAIAWISILLFASPVRRLLAKMIQSERLSVVSGGFFGLTLIASSIGMLSQNAIGYWMINWPEEVWFFFIPVLPYEGIARGIVGAVIGTGILAGMRATSMIKPGKALY